MAIEPDKQQVGDDPDATIYQSASKTEADAGNQAGDETLLTDAPAVSWDELSERVESFMAECERNDEPPELSKFLPESPPVLRRLVLAELVKHDIEYRWSNSKGPKKLEDYLGELPELGAGDGPSCDLIYEEYRVRTVAGENVSIDEYCTRFPTHAAALRRMIDTAGRNASTSMLGRKPRKGFNLGARIDDFDLLCPLGEGAFAEVYLAHQRSMQRRVALKVSRDSGDEPRALAQFDHPNIVRVFDQREVPEKEIRLLYMEYVPGGTLESVVKRVRPTPAQLRTGSLLLDAIDDELSRRDEPPKLIGQSRERLAELPWAEIVCQLGIQLASAIESAHGTGTLHRDIKPANILLSAAGTPKLADFNISYSSKLDGATPAAFFGGSLAYMSPEQLEASNPHHDRKPDDLDGRSDIYSLGVVLWELLIGTRPFPEEQIEGDWSRTLEKMVADRHAGVASETVERLSRESTAGICKVLQKCLAAKPEDRFATAADLMRQLQLCLRPETQELLEEMRSPWYEAVRRRPLLVTIAIALLPNTILSVANVAYDYMAIVSEMGAEASWVFLQMLSWWKAILYTAGTIVGVWYALPVFVALSRRPAPDALPSLRKRCLGLGDVVFGVSIGAWFLSGLVFPAWMEYRGHEITVQQYFHFFASHCLCGLIAGTLAFFMLALLSLRAIYPRLLSDELADDGDVAALTSLRNRLDWYSKLAVVVPFAAAISMGFASPGYRLAFIALALLGLGSLWVSSLLWRRIRTILDALIAAISPGPDDTTWSTSSAAASRRW